MSTLDAAEPSKNPRCVIVSFFIYTQLTCLLHDDDDDAWGILRNYKRKIKFLFSAVRNYFFIFFGKLNFGFFLSSSHILYLHQFFPAVYLE